ncbi:MULTISPECIES: AraC family transcriptional regulator [Pseudomonas]|uniref:Transcriptional regulator n=1 Tax=Pseudomonas cichorii TaxID=36746 RepID=A0ABQ1DL43_PSECI|nr:MULTISPECIES: AraC family transcriptional regulator [Pseudomonas]AHF66626.1 AraC family transcriptional regulator [Pseudomonas cichorii JBC1]QVE18539.1 AraC family transcriptional regulator [Pseudomonas cichorii]SDO08853.1 transcriptional regulator, AraC family [Pseudomonas cichorii]GFM67099.1 transcriptional regulator [Pseudomonas cichorii]GFM74516.1 transcriptional regulator [Pseudomonas cichorii]
MGSLEKLVDLISRHSPTDGIHPTPIAGVSLVRSGAPTIPMPVVYEPTLCLIAQGRKQVVVGTTSYVYDAAKYLVASVDIPVTGSVIEASETTPYLCLVLDLDMAVLSDLVLRYPSPEGTSGLPAAGIELNDTTPELLDAAARLAALLDTPDDIEALAPLTIREILYRLLTSSGNGVVRQLAKADSRLSQIAKAIAWLRSHYSETCRIDDIADIAGMSRSTFHAHFKAVTSMSPLEFRSQLRLQEARRLMVAEALDAAGAGYRVGYESPSQFSRDYVRMFGLSPARDASRLRGAVQEGAATLLLFPA